MDQTHRHPSTPQSRRLGLLRTVVASPGGNGKDYSALGVYGQYIYADPASRTVVVKLSDYGDQQDEQETFDALRAIAQSS